MQDSGSKVSLRVENLGEVLSQKLENETAILEALLVALAKGHPHPELWQRLHDAALRDDRLAEVAFAYERISQDRRLRIMPAQSQAQVALHAADFFAECFGDLDGASSALERVLSLVPGHPEAFQKLVGIAERRGDTDKLVQLCLSMAGPKADRDTQLSFLRRALELSIDGDDERTIKIATQLLRLEPADEQALAVAEHRLLAAARFSDVAKMLEQALAAAAPTLDRNSMLRMRVRLIELYDTKLAEIERAMPHVEEVLSALPSHDVARKTASRLLEHKAMAPRAAAALAGVYEADGDTDGVARMLTLQVEQLRGPKKTEAQKRLAKLQLASGDEASALANLEAVVLADASDEEARQAFVDACLSQNKLQDAARVLSRGAAGAKDPGLRGRVNADLARVHIVLGDFKRAKTVLANVLDTAGDDAAILAASRQILPLFEEGKESRQIAATLEKLGKLEPEPAAQAAAWMQLAALAENELDDPETAIEALRSVMEVAPSREANEGLERLYEASGKHAELADLLERRAASLGVTDEGRALSLRVAKLRGSAGDRNAAIDAFTKMNETFGPSREVNALLVPLLEQAKRTEELLAVLASEIALSEEPQHPPVLLKIAHIASKAGDTARALSTYASVLAIVSDEPTARAHVERAMRDGEHRLAAADILAPIFESERDTAGRIHALDVRADFATSIDERLAALEEGSALASAHPSEQGKALGLAGRGLMLAMDTDVSRIGPWIDRIEELVPSSGIETAAQTLALALGDRPIDSEPLARLARSAGKLLVEAGDSKLALELYRSVLVYEPQNSELLALVDGLLEEQGSPADRVRLYETALERHREPARRRELFHKIGAVQRRDLGEVRAAVDTYKKALAEFPDDKAFRGALYAAYEASSAWGELYDELTRATETASADERPNLEKRLAEVSLSAGELERAAKHFAAVLASDAELVAVHLDAAEGLAQKLGDSALLRQVLERRLVAAASPDVDIALLERLGELELGPLADATAAARRFERAASAAEAAGDLDTALRFSDRVLAIEPRNIPTLQRVAVIAKSSGDTRRLVSTTRAIIASTEDVEQKVRLALSLAPEVAADPRAFVELLDELVAECGARLDLLSAKAKNLEIVDPALAAETYRAMLAELDADDAAEAADMFEQFLSEPREGAGDEAREDRRALFGFKAKRAEPAERRRVLFQWARAEREQMGDAARAAELVAELLVDEPDDIEALELGTDIDLALDRFEAASEKLERRLAASEGDAKREISIRLVDILQKKLSRPGQALEILAPLLDETPTDSELQKAMLETLDLAGSLGPELAPTAVKAVEHLSRAAEHLESADERASVYESLLATHVESPELTEARPGLFDKLLACLKDAPDRALAIALRAVGEYPAEEALWDRAERLAREAKQPERVAMAYRQTLGSASTRLSPEVAMAIGQRGVDFQEEWFDDQDAVAHMLKLVVDVAPSATWAFERLKLVYNAGERWPDLFALYDRVIEGTADREEKMQIVDDAAQVAKDLAGDHDRAIGYLEQLHALDPKAERTSSSLERLYERHGKHRELIALLGERLASATPAARATRNRIAFLYVDGLGELDKGRQVAEEALAVEVADPEAKRALERILELTGGVSPVVVEGVPRLEHLLKIGGRAQPGPESRKGPTSRRSGTPPRKTTPPPKAASTPPDRDSSPPGDTSTRASSPPGEISSRNEVRKLSALALRTLHLGASRPAQAATMIEIALEAPHDPVQRNELLRELIELQRGPLGEEARAFETLALHVMLEPHDKKLRKELMKAADDLGNHDRLIDVLLAVSERSDSEKEAIEILETASRVCRETVKDPARSISIDLRILSRSDRDPLKAKEAARQLDRRLAEAGRDAERCGVLERLADLETDPDARGEVLHEIARLSDQVLGDPARAARALRRRLVDAPEDLVALSALVDNLRAANEHQELARALERRVVLVTAPERQRRDLVELARISSNELQDPEAAIAAFERVVGEFGADDEVADELIILLRSAGRTERLAALLASEAARSKIDARASTMLSSLGHLHRAEGRPSEAAISYARALERVPGAAAAEIGLEGLLPELEGVWALLSASVDALEASYRATDAFENSIALVPARIKTSANDSARATVLLEAADLEEKRSGDPARALASTFRAFALDAERPNLAGELLRRARLSGRWDMVVPDLLAHMAGRTLVAGVARDLLVDAADWASREDSSIARVEALLEAALVWRPYDAEVLARLVEARRRSPSEKLVTSLVELARALVSRSTEPEASLNARALEYHKEALTVAVRTLGDRELALDVAKDLLDEAERRWIDVGRLEAPREDAVVCAEVAELTVGVLVELHTNQGEGDESGVAEPRRAYEALIRAAGFPFDDKRKRALLLRASELAEPSEAIDIFKKLYDKDPLDAEVAGLLEALLTKENRRAEIVAVRKRQIEVARTTEERVVVRVSLAQLDEEIGDLSAAEHVLLENLAEEPTHPVSVGFLARLYESQGKTDELVALYEGQAMVQEGIEPAQAIETWARVATLSEERLDDLTRAAKARRRVVDLGPSVSALDELARVLEKAKLSADAAVVLERLVAEAGSFDEAKVLRLATAYEAAGHASRALAWLERGDELPQASTELRTRLRQAYRGSSMFEPLAALLARDAASSPDPVTRLSRLREAAALYASELGTPARAIPLLEEALDLDKADLSTRLLLSDALRAERRFESASAILQGLLEEYGTRRPKERALVHFELAKVSLSLGDRAKAMAELDAASKIDQGHPGILHALARLALQEGQLLRAQRTFRALLLVVKASRAPARDSFAATPLPESAGKVLETPVSRSEVLVELAAIAELQGDADRKSEFVESAFEAARESSWEAEQLTLALSARGWNELVARVLEERASSAVTPREKAHLLVTRADVLMASITGEPGAVGEAETLEQALGAALLAVDTDPTSSLAHDRALDLSRRAKRVERYAELVAEIGKRPSSTPELAIELALFEARTKESEFSDDAGAREAYERALEMIESASEPRLAQKLDVLTALEKVLERVGDRPARIAALTRVAELGTEAGRGFAEQAAALYQLARLHLEGDEGDDLGIDRLENAAEIDPDPAHVETELRAALGYAPKSLRVARLFEDHCRATGRKEGLVDALCAVADRDDDPLPSLREAYEVCLETGNADRAELLLLRIVQMAGDTEGAQWALVALGERRLANQSLVEAADLFERASKLGAPEEERVLLLRVAGLAATSLGDRDRAIRIYESLRTREPADRDIWAPLASVYQEKGDIGSLGVLFEETIPLVDDIEERCRLRLTLANMLLAVDPERSAALLGEVLEEDAHNERAAQLLTEIYSRSGEQGKLAELLQKRLDAAKDAEDKPRVVSISIELGKLLEQQGDDTGALEIFHATLDWDADARDALRAVVRIGMKRDDSVGVGDELDRLLSIEEGQAAVDLAFKVAEMKRGMGDDSGAERALLAGMKARPENVELRDELVRAYTARGAQKELADLRRIEIDGIVDPTEKKAALVAIADTYKAQMGEMAAAAEALGKAHEIDPADRDILFNLMDALSGLGEHKQAIAAVERSLERDKEGDPSWLYFSRAVLFEALGESDRALDDLEEAHRSSGGKYGSELRAHLESALVAIGRNPEGSSRTESATRLRLAEVTAELGDEESAKLLIGELLRRDPRDRAALRALAHLDENAERWEGAMASLRKLVPLEEGDALVDVSLRLAHAAMSLGRVEDARSGLERALKASPSDARLRGYLKEVYVATGETSGLAAMCVEEARATSDIEGRHALLLEASRYFLADGAEAGQALELLEEARSLRPEDTEAQALLAEVLAAVGRAAEARVIVKELIAGHRGRRSKELGRAHHVLSKIENAEGNLSEALEALSRAFENDPQNVAMAMELGQQAVDLDDAEVAQRAFRSVTLLKNDAGAGAHDKAMAYYHLGRIALTQGDRRRAKLMLEKALSEDPAIEEARSLLEQLG